MKTTLILAMTVSLAAGAAERDTAMIQNIDVTAIWRGRTGNDATWFHPRACTVPGENGAEIIMTLQPVTGSDIFHTVHWTRSRDLGKTWTKPAPIAGFARVRLPDGTDDGVCDVVPEYHARTGKIIAMGHNVYYRNNKLTKPSIDRHPVYVVGDGKGAWSERRVLKWDDPRASSMYTSNCGQRVTLENGDILVPVSFFPRGRKDRFAGSLLCAFDGEFLTVKASTKKELRNPAGRGLLEPSMVRFENTYYMTIRAEDGHGYVAESADGLEWTGMKAWAWEDGKLLGMSTTQQHWIAHSDGLFLAYTRRDASNAKVMRWRSPIWIAQVDTEKRCLIRATERVVIPLFGDGVKQPAGVPRMGNFHVVSPTPDETWITVGECLPTGGWKGDTFLARVRWEKPNRLVASAGVPPRTKLPNPILCAYTGWFAVNDPDDDFDAWAARMIEPLHKAEFNCFSPKIQAHRSNKYEPFNLTSPKQFERMKKLSDACVARGMTLITYVYTTRTKRNPVTDAELFPAVNQDGVVIETCYSLIQWAAWRQLMDRAFQLAEVSKRLPIAAVSVDLEIILHTPVSYDDGAWNAFCVDAGLPRKTPATERYALLEKEKKTQAYLDWWSERLADIAKRYEREMHAINPDLSLGIMPAGTGNIITRPFVRYLGTPRAPAIIDSWSMYNGSGLTEGILEQQAQFKEENPNNLYVCWFRPDNYTPDDLRVQAYHAAMKLDGYNNWHIGMFVNEDAPLRVPKQFTLKQYQDAYRDANLAALRDKPAGAPPTSIPWCKVTPRVANLPMAEILAMPVPNLIPAGDGTGKAQRIVTRDQRRFYFWAEAGQSVQIEITQLAGARRPTSLDYAVLDPDRNVLRHEQVSPGTTDRFTVTAPRRGVCSLHVKGSVGGGPWYGVRIEAKHMAIPAFDKKDPGRFFFGGGGTRDTTMWCTRADAKEEAKITLSTGRGQAVEMLVGDADSATAQGDKAPATLALPAGAKPIQIRFREPPDMAEGFYSQTVFFWLDGAVHPYVSDGAQRRLVPAAPSQ
ncbi:MAG: exo-alpha-sialidase [Lentisphaeria bacterium]|nr:exo-alpha-sialidase [Lentisphaeria bacterium]